MSLQIVKGPFLLLRWGFRITCYLKADCHAYFWDSWPSARAHRLAYAAAGQRSRRGQVHQGPAFKLRHVPRLIGHCAPSGTHLASHSPPGLHWPRPSWAAGGCTPLWAVLGGRTCPHHSSSTALKGWDRCQEVSLSALLRTLITSVEQNWTARLPDFLTLLWLAKNITCLFLSLCFCC